MRPVEQMVDSAIDRIAREKERPIELARRSAGDALARRDATLPPVPRVPTRLRWRGLDVSEEFRQYAERVARGEDLPPFEGRVLAEPNPEFPWGKETASDVLPTKRGPHPVLWGAAVVVLGLIGWSLILRTQGGTVDGRPALATSVAPLAAPQPPAQSATPHDVVDTRAASARTPTDGAGTPSVLPTSQTSPASEVAAAPAVADEPSTAPAPLAPSEPALVTSVAPAAGALEAAALSPASAAPSGPSVAVDLSRPGALQRAVGTALANRSAAAPAPTSPKPVEDEFGIMSAGDPAPVAAAPAAASPSPAPAGAKSNGNVGDSSRAGQPPAPGVRKEPGSESSAKGSLLIETPSF